MSCHRTKSGFTLVELLVVIAIIGILVALLLPAVQAAREAARRMQCSNNLKQMALAMHNYHDTYKKFPLGGNWKTPWAANRGQRANRGNGWAWSAMILPFVEQSTINDQLDFRMRLPELPNRPLVATLLAVARCPSGTQPNFIKIGQASDQFGYVDPGLTATNYVACAGSFVQSAYYNQADARKNGILFEDSEIGFKDVTDGTSNTILIGETKFHGDGSTPSFFWDPSWFGRYRHNSGGRADAPEALMRVGRFRINPPSVASNNIKRNTFSSLHPGGAQFGLADGSVRFISETVENNEIPWGTINGGAPWSTLGTFQRLCGRNDGQTLKDF